MEAMGLRRRQFEAAQRDSIGGLLTRLNLLAQRHDAEVMCQHSNHRWVVGVQWESVDGAGGGRARVEGVSLTACLADVLHQVHA